MTVIHLTFPDGTRIPIKDPAAVKTPKIQGKELTQEDIGRQVTFTYPHGERCYGVLSSFREDGAIFVRFNGPTGERCDAERLSWG